MSRADFLRFGGGAAAATAAAAVLASGPAGAAGQVVETGDANVKNYGAVGDGIANDTAAIQAAIDASLGVYFPAGIYRCTATITLRNGSRLVGEASGVEGNPGSQLDFSAFNYGRAVQGPPGGGGTGHGVTMSNLWIRGSARTVPEIEGFPAIGYYARSQNSGLWISSCAITGFTFNCWLEDATTALLLSVRLSNAVRANLVLWGGCTNVRVLGCAFTVPNETGAASSSALLANVWFLQKDTGATRSVTIQGCVIDEVARLGQTVPPATLRIDGGEDIFVSESVVWMPVNDGSGYGVKIGAGCRRVSLRDIRVEPYERDANHTPVNTILIDAGSSGTVLTNVTTDPNGGGDIADGAADTVLINVNGVTRFRGGVAPGAVTGLPAPGPATRGQLLRLTGDPTRDDALYLGVRTANGADAWERLVGLSELDAISAAVTVREFRLPGTLHGLQNWYDLSAALDYAAVTDLSGRGRTTDHRYNNLDPVPRTDPGLFAGKRYAKFDGANNRALVASTAVTGSGLTVMIVGRIAPGASGIGRLFAITDNRGTDFTKVTSCLVYHSAVNVLTSYRFYNVLTSSSITDGRPFVLLVTYDGSLNRHQVAEAGGSSGVKSTGNFDGVDLVIGGGKQVPNAVTYTLACDVVEAAVWDRSLPEVDLAALATYARRRWAL